MAQPTTQDHEIAAMQTIAAALGGLPHSTRERVLGWTLDRFRGHPSLEIFAEIRVWSDAVIELFERLAVTQAERDEALTAAAATVTAMREKTR